MSQEDFQYLEDIKLILVEGQQALQLVFPICLPLRFVRLFFGAWHPFVKVLWEQPPLQRMLVLILLLKMITACISAFTCMFWRGRAQRRINPLCISLLPLWRKKEWVIIVLTEGLRYRCNLMVCQRFFGVVFSKYGERRQNSLVPGLGGPTSSCR